MSGYDTQQRRVLLEFLAQNCEKSYTVEELFEGLSLALPRERIPGRSTLYRLVSKLVAEGDVKRFSGDQGRTFRYQLVGCGARSEHLHLKCTQCGCLIHMDCALSKRIFGEVLDSSEFSLDQKETVLFGVCKDCREHAACETAAEEEK